MVICFCLMFIWSVELTLRRYRTAITSDKVYRSYHFSETLTGFIIKRGDYSCDKTTANLWNSRSFVPNNGLLRTSGRLFQKWKLRSICTALQKDALLYLPRGHPLWNFLKQEWPYWLFLRLDSGGWVSGDSAACGARGGGVMRRRF